MKLLTAFDTMQVVSEAKKRYKGTVTFRLLNQAMAKRSLREAVVLLLEDSALHDQTTEHIIQMGWD